MGNKGTRKLEKRKEGGLSRTVGSEISWDSCWTGKGRQPWDYSPRWVGWTQRSGEWAFVRELKDYLRGESKSGYSNKNIVCLALYCHFLKLHKSRKSKTYPVLSLYLGRETREVKPSEEVTHTISEYVEIRESCPSMNNTERNNITMMSLYPA